MIMTDYVLHAPCSARTHRAAQDGNDHSSSSCSSDDLHVFSIRLLKVRVLSLVLVRLYNPRWQFIPALTNRHELWTLLACSPGHGQLNDPTQKQANGA